MPPSTQTFEPGQRVRVIQQIPQRDEVWTSRVEGTVIKVEQCKTGAWFAHSKDDKLWLDRMVLQKEDGEIVVCNLDAYTRIELLPAPPKATTNESADESSDNV